MRIDFDLRFEYGLFFTTFRNTQYCTWRRNSCLTWKELHHTYHEDKHHPISVQTNTPIQ